MDVSSAPVESVAPYLRKNLLNCVLLLAGSVLLFRSTLSELVRYWSSNPDFSHGFLIPLISASILFANRSELGALPARRSLPGLAVLVGALLLFFAGVFVSIHTVQRLAIWGSLVGAVWFVLGSSVLRSKPFPFFFLLLSIPPPFFLLSPLRIALKGVVTQIASDTLSLAGTPAYAHANVLQIGDHYLEVVDACSGIRSLLAIVALAALTAYVLRSGFWRGCLLTLTAVPVTVLVNAVRIVVVATALAHFGVDLTEGVAHDVVGVAIFTLSLVFLFASWHFYRWLFRWTPAAEAS